ncbi:unnamed protein product, partial [Ectocarpus sp. 12 AP-2014]
MRLEKKALRLEMTKRRAAAHEQVDPATALAALQDTLASTTGPVSFYWPIRTEIDPRPVMRALAGERSVCLPVTDGLGPLTFRAWQEGAPMQTDGFGVQTPDASAADVIPQVLVVPMLAFDLMCHRLGYGAGHYDKTIEALKSKSKITTIGLAYGAQKLD